MKNYFGKLVALALFAVALTGAALAQDSALRANIPFAFYAGGELMPAGEYTISLNVENRLVRIGQKATGSGHLLLGLPGNSSRDERTLLVFKLGENEKYALRELRGPDLGVSFSASGPRHVMKVQNQADQSVTIVAEVR